MVAAGVLISGAGTNLQALIDRIAAGRLDCAIRVVISNRAEAPGLVRAEAAGIPTQVIDHRRFASREDFDRALVDALRAAEVELVLLDAYRLRVMNIHPALLPSFAGLHAQRQALDHGVKIAGVTVHFVDEQTDHGPIIIQGAVPVCAGDTEVALRDRILAVEHEVYATAIQLFAEGRLAVEGRRVIVRGAARATPPPLIQW